MRCMGSNTSMDVLSTIDLSAFLAFAIISGYTPGPNTISSASMGLTYGYRRTIPYHLGIGTGFFLLMIASALVASAIKTLLPGLIPVLTVLGSLYILYLAVHMVRSSISLASTMPEPLGFGRGMLLQLFNPKALLMGLTIYSTFLVGLPTTIFWRGLSALFLAVLMYGSVTLYTLFGAALLKFLTSKKVGSAINIVLSLALVYTAITLVWPLIRT